MELYKTIEILLTNRFDNFETKMNLKFENLELKLDTSISALETKLDNSISGLDVKINGVDDKLTTSCTEQDEILSKIDEHEKVIGEATPFVIKIKTMDADIQELKKNMEELKEAPKNKVYEVFKQVVSKLGWVLLGILGFALIFAISNLEFWKTILTSAGG